MRLLTQLGEVGRSNLSDASPVINLWRTPGCVYRVSHGLQFRNSPCAGEFFHPDVPRSCLTWAKQLCLPTRGLPQMLCQSCNHVSGYTGWSFRNRMFAALASLLKNLSSWITYRLRWFFYPESIYCIHPLLSMPRPICNPTAKTLIQAPQLPTAPFPHFPKCPHFVYGPPYTKSCLQFSSLTIL